MQRWLYFVLLLSILLGKVNKHIRFPLFFAADGEYPGIKTKDAISLSAQVYSLEEKEGGRGAERKEELSHWE